MLIKYRGQLYKRIDAGEQKIAEVLKRKLQDDLKKAQLIDDNFKSASIDVTGRIDETKGGELAIWLNFKGSAEEARRLTDLMGDSMRKTAKNLNNLPFFKNRYFIDANILRIGGSGSRRELGTIRVEPKQRFSQGPGESNKPLLSKIGLSANEKRGYPRRSEDYKDQDSADAAKYAGDNLELNSRILKYADRLGRLDASLSREIKAVYAKCYQLARKCNELYKKHNKG